MVDIKLKMKFALFSVTALIVSAIEHELRYTVVEEEWRAGTFVADIARDTGIRELTQSGAAHPLFTLLAHGRIPLQLDNYTGILSVSSRVDREQLCPGKETCNEVISIISVQPGALFQMIRVRIDVEDINDNMPRFQATTMSFNLPETAQPGESIKIPPARDPDSPKFGVQRYSLAGTSNVFKLAVTYGEPSIVLMRSVDREREDVVNVSIVVYDGGEPPRSSTLLVVVNIDDVNDNKAEFDEQVYDVEIIENFKNDKPIITVRATDKDSGINGQVIYELRSKEYNDVFRLNKTSGAIFLKQPLDYEEQTEYRLYVTATNVASGPLPTETLVIVRVIDENDNAPVITVNTIANSGTPSVEVVEESDTGMWLAQVTVSDADSGRNGIVDCRVDDKKFALEQSFDGDYKLLTATKLDRERMQQVHIDINIICADRGNVGQPLISSKTIKVVVIDINDHAPIFTRTKYTTNVAERSAVGTSIIRVNATDQDQGKNKMVEYVLSPNGIPYFNIDLKSGVISLKVELNHEATPFISFSVYAKDGGNPPLVGSTLVNVTILDVNDEKPIFHQDNYQFNLAENLPLGTFVGTVSASDADGPLYNRFTYSIGLSDTKSIDKFNIDGRSGIIRTTKVLNREEDALHVFHIVVSDNDENLLASTATVSVLVNDINDNTPEFIFPSPNNNSIQVSTNSISAGTEVAVIKARDADDGMNKGLEYAIVSSSHENAFVLNRRTGSLSTSVNVYGPLQVLFNISATDGGLPPLVSFASLTVFIRNNNVSTSRSVTFSTVRIFNSHLVTVVTFCSVLIIVVCFLLLIGVCVKRISKRHRRVRKSQDREKEVAYNQDKKQPLSDIADSHTTLLIGSSPQRMIQTVRLPPLPFVLENYDHDPTFGRSSRSTPRSETVSTTLTLPRSPLHSSTLPRPSNDSFSAITSSISTCSEFSIMPILSPNDSILSQPKATSNGLGTFAKPLLYDSAVTLPRSHTSASKKVTITLPTVNEDKFCNSAAAAAAVSSSRMYYRGQQDVL